MKENIIINYIIKEKCTPDGQFALDNTYKLIKSNRFMDWIIKKLIQYGIIKQCYRELVEYKRIEIDKQSVFELIQEQLNNLLRRGEKPTKAILGYDAMQELKVELYENMRFSIELPYHEPGQFYTKKAIIELQDNKDGGLISPARWKLNAAIAKITGEGDS